MLLTCRTALHKALYWGHVHIGAILLTHGASTSVLDRKVCSAPTHDLIVGTYSPQRLMQRPRLGPA